MNAQEIIAQFDSPNALGIALVGSHARDEASAHSDIDLDIFTETLPLETYTLHLLDRTLISVKYISPADEFSALTQPHKAIWAAPGLRQMKILLDKTGEIARLQQAANSFIWTDKIQAAADKYAVKELSECAEEVHKIIGGLQTKNESKVLYAVWGLFNGMAKALATQRGLMIPSENQYFDLLQQSAGKTSAWTKAFRSALGAENTEAAQPAFLRRGNAALELYKQTAILLNEIIPAHRREIISHTLEVIEANI